MKFGEGGRIAPESVQKVNEWRLGSNRLTRLTKGFPQIYFHRLTFPCVYQANPNFHVFPKISGWERVIQTQRQASTTVL